MALAGQHGCTSTLEQVIVRLVRFIEAEEGRRGQIARSSRSNLSEQAARCQVILDKLMLVLIGIDADKHDYIVSRLDLML